MSPAARVALEADLAFKRELHVAHIKDLARAVQSAEGVQASADAVAQSIKDIEADLAVSAAAIRIEWGADPAEKGWSQNLEAERTVAEALAAGHVVDFSRHTTGEGNQDLVISMTIRHASCDAKAITRVYDPRADASDAAA